MFSVGFFNTGRTRAVFNAGSTFPSAMDAFIMCVGMGTTVLAHFFSSHGGKGFNSQLFDGDDIRSLFTSSVVAGLKLESMHPAGGVSRWCGYWAQCLRLRSIGWPQYFFGKFTKIGSQPLPESPREYIMKMFSVIRHCFAFGINDVNRMACIIMSDPLT